MFVEGHHYTRKEINALRGGGIQDYLPHKEGHVVAGCFNRASDPDAPDVILVGIGIEVRRWADVFCKQQWPVPVFVKEKPSHWEYMGDYQVERWTDEPVELAEHHERLKKKRPITRVLFLRRVSRTQDVVAEDLEALRAEEEYFEGGKKQRFTNYYERDPNLRVAVIEHHGMKCMACGFDFQEVYGERGTGYIEAHHLHPVSTLEQQTKVDPKTDMVVVCSNCHRMIHRRRDAVLSLEELRKIIQK